jgi:hypothetical protein
LNPQHIAPPEVVTAQVWPQPTEIWATPDVRPDTSTGLVLLIVVPSPSAPVLLNPQHFAPPDVVTAHDPEIWANTGPVEEEETADACGPTPIRTDSKPKAARPLASRRRITTSWGRGGSRRFAAVVDVNEGQHLHISAGKTSIGSGVCSRVERQGARPSWRSL